jgi:hypothetical protein
MPRPYKKRSDYWKKFDADGNKKPLESLYEMHGSKEWSPSFEGEPYYFAQAGYSRSSGSGGSTSYRQNAAASQPILNRFANIAEGMLPYNYRDQGYVDIQDAIQLCQKAYANIAIFRNTIDVMSEFSNSYL